MNSHFCRLPVRQFHGETVFYWNASYTLPKRLLMFHSSLYIYCQFALFLRCNGPDSVSLLLLWSGGEFPETEATFDSWYLCKSTTHMDYVEFFFKMYFLAVVLRWKWWFHIYAVYPSDNMMVRIVRTENQRQLVTVLTTLLPSAAIELSTSNWTTFCPSRWGDGAAAGHLWMLASWNTSEVNPLWNRFIRSSHSARTVMMSSLFAVYPSDLNGLLRLWLTELKCIGERNHVLYQKNLTVNINWQDSRQSTDEILIWKTRRGRYSTQVKYLHQSFFVECYISL